MYEGALFYKNFSRKPSFLKKDEQFVLVTFHRAETTDDLNKLINIIHALNEISNEIKVIVPIHPRTKKIIEKNNIPIKFNFVNPVGYLEMVWLIANSKIILTDSGGLQKEAYFFKKVCITMRNETEWVELIKSGNNILVGTRKEKILKTYHENPNFKNQDKMIYGKGDTSKIIVKSMLYY